MIDLQEEFKELLHVVADYHSGKPERLTDVLYLWWKVYHLVNCKIKEAKTLLEKEAVIKEFQKFSQDLNQLYDEMAGMPLGEENSEDVDPDNPSIPFMISSLLKMLYTERELLAKTMQALKKEKTRGAKKPKIRSARQGKKGWIRE